MLNFAEMTPETTFHRMDSPPVKKRCVARKDALEGSEVIRQLFSNEAEEPNSDCVEAEHAAESERVMKEDSGAGDGKLCSCYVTEDQVGEGLAHEQVNKTFGLGIEESHLIPAKKRAAMMASLVKILFYAILQYAKFERLKENCPGCLFDEGNQMSHCCLSWDSRYMDDVLKSLCSKIDMRKFLHTLIALALALDSLSLNKNHLSLASKIQNRILRSKFPSYTVAMLIKEKDKVYLRYAEKLVHGLKYTYYLNFCDLCVEKE